MSATIPERDKDGVVAAIERAWNTAERWFSRWPTGWVIIFALLLAVLIELLSGGGVGDIVLVTLVSFSQYARRDRFLRDFRTSWAGYLVLAFVFGFPAWVRHRANAPGDVYEVIGDREVGAYQWLPYDAEQNGTNPLDLLGKFVVTLKPGAKIKVRPSGSKIRPGGFVVQLDGDAMIEVKPTVDHVTVAGSTGATTAVLLPGTYELHGLLRKNAVQVRRISGDSAVAVRGGAQVVH